MSWLNPSSPIWPGHCRNISGLQGNSQGTPWTQSSVIWQPVSSSNVLPKPSWKSTWLLHPFFKWVVCIFPLHKMDFNDFCLSRMTERVNPFKHGPWSATHCCPGRSRRAQCSSCVKATMSHSFARSICCPTSTWPRKSLILNRTSSSSSLEGVEATVAPVAAPRLQFELWPVWPPKKMSLSATPSLASS